MVLSLILVLISGLILIWFLWVQEYLEVQNRRNEAISRVSTLRLEGYRQKDETQINTFVPEYILQTVYGPLPEHSSENIKRVAEDVVVTIIGFANKEGAMEEIEYAGFIYSWDWRNEEISGQEIYAGYFLDLNRGVYTEAYIGWAEGSTYFEVVARPKKLEDFEDKDFLCQAAKEVAESIIIH